MSKRKLASSIQRLRTKVRLVPFLTLFLLKASCTLILLNFYMATQISTDHQSDHDSSLSVTKMLMHQTERDEEKLEISNTQDSYNKDYISHAIINQTTSNTATNTENERMITPNVMNGTLQGKERLWAILQTRNVTQVNANYWASVPSWDTILHNLFRPKKEKKDPIDPLPIIHGLETCNAFQERTSSNPSQRRIAPAGLFNTGTNYLSVLLEYNCQNPHRVSKFHGNAKRGHGNEWEVPWGKHTPASFRDKYTKSSREMKYTIEEVLPIVMIRNPYSWMKSMCRNPYTARWKGMHDSKTCPQLTKNAREDGGSPEYNAVDVNYGPGPSHHKSLGHLWNEWYGEYIYSNTTNGDGDSTVFNTSAPFPRLIIRFEDIIFFPFEVTKQICACAGGILGHRNDDKDVANGTFHYVVRSAKAGWGHGPASQRNGLIDSWVRYGIESPKDAYSEFEKRVVKEVLDPWIMDTFEYG